MISFEDFKKVELRVGTVVKAEHIEGADKLLRLMIDTGDKTRQIIAGISKHYEPGDLVDKQVAVVCNLEPKELMGELSEGMLLAASDDDIVSLLSPDKELNPGSQIK